MASKEMLKAFKSRLQISSSGWVLLALILLFVVGLLIRLGVQDFFVDVYYFGGLTSCYKHLANSLVETGSYTLRDLHYVGQPPGYPLYLAFWKWVGDDNLQLAGQAQCFINCLGVFLCYWIGAQCGLRKAMAILLAACYAVFFPLVFGTGFLLSEAFSPLFVLVTIAGGIWVAEKPSFIRVLLLGLLLGVAPMVRADLLFLPFFVIVFWLFKVSWKRTALLGTCLLTIWFIPTLLWGIHNKVHHDAWVFTTTGGGNTLWEGLGELPNEYGFILDDGKTGKMLAEKGFRWHSIEADQYLKQEYLRAWREHPGFVLRVIGHRWLNILSGHRSRPDPRFPISDQIVPDRGVWLALGVLALLIERRNRNFIWAFSLPVLYACLSIGLVHWEPRYVRYVDIAGFLAVIMLLSWGWRHGPATWRARPWKHDLLPAAIAIIMVGAVSIEAWSACSKKAQLPASKSVSQTLTAWTLAVNRLEDHRQFLRAIPLFDSQQISPAVVSISDSTVMINGASPRRNYYLASWKIPTDLDAEAVLVARGTLDVGGISVGLLSSDNKWIQQQRIGTPGQFQIALPLEHHTGTTAIISNFVKDPSQITRATVHLELLIHDPSITQQ